MARIRQAESKKSTRVYLEVQSKAPKKGRQEGRQQSLMGFPSSDVDLDSVSVTFNGVEIYFLTCKI